MDTTERKDGDTPSGNTDQPPVETTKSSGEGAELDDLLGSLGDAIDQLKEAKPSDAEPAAGPVAEPAVAPVTVEPVAAEQNPVSAYEEGAQLSSRDVIYGLDGEYLGSPPAVASEESVAAAAAEPIVAPAPVAVDGVSEIDLAGLEAGVQASTVLPVVGDEIQPIQVEEPAAAVAVTAAAPEEVAAAEAAPAPAAEAEKEKPVVVVDEDGAVDKGMTETLRMLDSGLVDPKVADKKGKDADKDADKDGSEEEPDIASLTGTSRRKLVKMLTIGGTAVAAALVGAYLVSEYKPETASPVTTPKPEPQASAPVPTPEPTPEPTLAPVAPAPISELTADCCFKYVQPGPTGRAKMPEAECDGNNFEVGNFSNDGKPVDGQVATTLKGTINGKTVECETNMDANAFKALYRGETTATTFDCEPARCTVVQ